MPSSSPLYWLAGAASSCECARLSSWPNCKQRRSASTATRVKRSGRHPMLKQQASRSPAAAQEAHELDVVGADDLHGTPGQGGGCLQLG